MIPEQAATRTLNVRVARLAWSLWTLSVVLVVLGVLFALNNRVGSSITSPYLANLIVPALACSTVGALIASRRSENAIGWLFSASGLLYGATVFAGEYSAYALLANQYSLPGGVVMLWIASWLWRLAGSLVVLLLLLFPDGRLPSPRWRPLALLAALNVTLVPVLLIALAPGPLEGFPKLDNPFGLGSAAGFFSAVETASVPLEAVGLLVPVAALVVRYRRSRGEERQQIKWIAYAAAILAVTIGAVNLRLPLEVSVVGRAIILLAFLAIPVSIVITIFKYRLYDIDLVINRTLVYGALTACVVGIYVLVVGYLGVLFRVDGNLLISLFATSFVAVLFQPLRERLQRGVNRLMYGERDEPYAVISRLGQRLEATLEPRAVLPAVVETVSQALKLPYVAIALEGNGKRDGYAVAAAYGSPVDSPLRLPLAYRNEPVGELLLAPRAGEESFSAADRRLLEDLARQAGVAAHAVRLTADLQRARERLVSAREEERRRLRRDLHDGLGPQLSSQTLTIDAVRTLMRRDPDSAEALLLDLKAQTQDAISDVRRLVYALRPPALDDLGFVAALGEISARQRQGDLDVSIAAPESLPTLPAAVEVAAYRIVQEAITNVVRHAEASACFVSLEVDDDAGMLRLEVRDDGRGMGANRGAGVGLTSMRERAEELGGNLVVETSPGGGTVVRAGLPLPEEG